MKKINTQNELIKTNYDTKVVRSAKKKRASVISFYSEESFTSVHQSNKKSCESLDNSSFLSEFLERYYKLANDGICKKTCTDETNIICPTPSISPCEYYSPEIIKKAEKKCLPEFETKEKNCAKVETTSISIQTESAEIEKNEIFTQTSPLNLSFKSINTSFVECPQICSAPYIVDKSCGSIFKFPSVECVSQDVSDFGGSFECVGESIELNRRPHSFIQSPSDSFIKLPKKKECNTPNKIRYTPESIEDKHMRSPLTCSTSSFSKLIPAYDDFPVELPQPVACCVNDLRGYAKKFKSTQTETMKLSCRKLSLKISISSQNDCLKSLCCDNYAKLSKSSPSFLKFNCRHRNDSFFDVAKVSHNPRHDDEIYYEEKCQTIKKNCVKFSASTKDNKQKYNCCG